ncbi:MAG: hypothetical protein FWE42_01240 [Defluviitaleaceae bacterium]|nr:hypothetical protein [Defluviitaleaceae bacterium]
MENEQKQSSKTEKKKQIPLRLSESLYNELASWAEDDFRSLNGQIEYLLTQCVNKQRCEGKDAGDSY